MQKTLQLKAKYKITSVTSLRHSERFSPMDSGYLIDFYHGWLIEVLPIGVSRNEPGFKMVCYSPCREKFCNDQVYPSAFEAMKAAKQAINWHVACQLLRDVLRQFYEADRLEFEEWRSLHQSLTAATKAL